MLTLLTEMFGHLPTLIRTRLGMCSTSVQPLLSLTVQKVGVLPRAGGFMGLEPFPGKICCKERGRQGFGEVTASLCAVLCLLDKGCSRAGSHRGFPAPSSRSFHSCYWQYLIEKRHQAWTKQQPGSVRGFTCTQVMSDPITVLATGKEKLTDHVS